jgi:hypothetical protein
MPVLQVYYPQGSLQGERKAALARRLTDVLLMMEDAETQGGLAAYPADTSGLLPP